MQVFKLYFRIAKTQLVSMAIVVVVFLMILNFTDVSSVAEEFSETAMSLTVYDEDQTEESRHLVDYLSRHNRIAEVEDQKDQLIDALYFTSTDYVITIREGFAERIKRGETEGLFLVRYIHDSYTNRLADEMLETYVSTVQAYRLSRPDYETAEEDAVKALEKPVSVRMDRGAVVQSGKVGGFFNYLPYAIFSLVVTVIAPVLIAMNKKEVAFRTYCSRTSMKAVSFQTLLAGLVSVMGIWLLLMGLGLVKNGEIFAGNLWFGVANSLVFTLVSVAIALFLAVLGVSENVLGFLTQVLGMSMAFLCGMFVPLAFLDESVTAIGRFLPAYWYVRANDMICGLGSENFDLSGIMRYMGIEFLFAAAIFVMTMSVSRLKRR